MGKAYDVMAPTCPSHAMLHRIGARWTIFVITALRDRPMRYTELKTCIRGIAPKVLSETLRALQHDGLVSRTDFDENPPRVEYALTPLGESLWVPLHALREWAESNMPAVLAARDAQESDPLG